MLKRQGWRRAVLGAVVAAGAAVGLLVAGAPAQAATGTPQAVTSYSFTSVSGDYIGGGASATYKPPAATIGVSGDAGDVRLAVDQGDDWWYVDLAAPRGDVLRPGVYRNAERASFRTGRSPGLDVYGDGRGCNEVYGQFTVNQIQTGADGAVTLLDATFTQHCENADAPPLKGTVKYQAYPLSYSAVSDPGDYIGGGESVSYTNALSTFTLRGNASGFDYGVSGKRDDWDVTAAAPSGEQFTLGKTYPTTRFGGGGTAALDVYGDGRGCNESSGELTITKLVTDSSGAISNLAATFTQHCENGTPALHGTIHYFA